MCQYMVSASIDAMILILFCRHQYDKVKSSDAYSVFVHANNVPSDLVFQTQNMLLVKMQMPAWLAGMWLGRRLVNVNSTLIKSLAILETAYSITLVAFLQYP